MNSAEGGLILQEYHHIYILCVSQGKLCYPAIDSSLGAGSVVILSRVPHKCLSSNWF